MFDSRLAYILFCILALPVLACMYTIYDMTTLTSKCDAEVINIPYIARTTGHLSSTITDRVAVTCGQAANKGKTYASVLGLAQ